MSNFFAFFGFVRSMEKMTREGPKWGQEDLFPTNPDLADILGKADLDFDNFHVFFIFWIPNLWISRSPDFQIPRSRPGPGLGGLGPARALLRGGSAALPDHKVGEIQGTRTIP